MLIINPGSTHFDVSDGSATLTYSDYATPGTTVASLSNNPAKVTAN